jgi:hypothetical protein
VKIQDVGTADKRRSSRCTATSQRPRNGSDHVGTQRSRPRAAVDRVGAIENGFERNKCNRGLGRF